MEKETILWAITKEQLQEVAQEVLSRQLTDDEVTDLSEEIIEQGNLLEIKNIIRELIEGLKS